MVTALVDTSVIIDLLRGYPAAQTWYLTQNDLGVCRVVWLEVLEGAENGAAQRDAVKLLQRFELVELTTPDLVWATEKLIAYNLRYSMDAFDCLIASVNARLQIPLYTRNMKHFAPMLNGLAQRPYA
jgi:predicted nucleic acid-binding protein